LNGDDHREPTPAEKAKRARFWRRLTITELAIVAVVGLFALLFAAGVGGRFAVLTPWGRSWVETVVSGKELGRFGRLNVYGLKGDLWHDFTLDRATISDAKGVWVEARHIHVRWRAIELFARTFHAEDIIVTNAQLLRRPELKPEITPPGPLPLTVKIDRLAAQLDLMESFGKTYGHWLLSGNANVHRVGAKDVNAIAHSVSQPGDFVKVAFSNGGPKGVQLDAQAFEAGGGPIAGSLGYSAKDPFVLNAQAHGAPSKGWFTAAIRSGRYLPLSVNGDWNANGATASGQAALAGSDLLRPLAERAGENARFGLSAQKQSAHRFAVAAVVFTENVNARAQGVIETTTQTAPDGLLVDLDTSSVSRLLKTQIAGPGRFHGVVAGNLGAWALKGDANLSNVAVGGYTLASVTGPVQAAFDGKKLEVQTQARGTGGAGTSWLAGLIGPRPAVNADFLRLEDGRLLLQHFEGKGAGLEVTGSGSRGLLGGLNFHGHASLTNVANLRAGARGVIDSPIDASQPGPGKPWRLTFDARARNLQTGLGELDRLLGATPRLQADGALDKGRFAVDRATLTGRAGQVNGKGIVGLDGDLKLLLGWTAKGPFEAGPVEIAGNASGSGALTGTIAQPRADLKARFDEIAVGQLTLTKSDVVLTFQRDPRGFDGRVAVIGASAWGPARGASDFRFAGDGVRLDNLVVDAGGVQAKGSLALRRGAPSAADLAFTAGPGAFLEAGHAQGRVRIADNGGLSAATSIELTGSDLQPRGSSYTFQTIKLAGQGTLAHMPFTIYTEVGGAEPVKFAGNGLYARTATAQTIALTGGGQLRRATFRTLSPLTLAFTDHGRALKADLEVGGGRMIVTGDAAGGVLDGKASLAGVDLGAFGEGVQGRVDANATLTGRGGRLGGELDAKLADIRPREGPKKFAVDGTIKAVLAGERLHLEAQALDRGGGVNANANLDLPVVDSVTPLHLAIARDRNMGGRFAISGEVQPIWDLFLGGDRSLSGQVQSQGTIAGSLNNPVLDGSAAVRNGRFEDSGTGLVLKNFALDVAFDHEAARVHDFEADDGKGGHVSGNGVIEMARGGASTFNLDLKNFQAIDNDVATARASGQVKVTRAATGQIKLAGELNVTRADIAPKLPTSAGVVSMDVIEINAPPGREQFKPPKRGPGAALDLTLKAARGVFLRGRGLDMEFALNAHVGGTTSDPELTGVAHVTRGDFNFSGQRFQFDERGTVTLSMHPDQIRFDLRAVRDNPSLTASVLVHGTAAKPEVTLTSDPALPQDEILSQVLFGTSAAQLSPIEAAQLASAVGSLGGGKGFDILGGLRELAGLDRLVFATEATATGAPGATTVAAGKYLSDRVYLELIGGGKEGAATQLEWRARKNLSIISRFGGQGDAKLAIRWRKDLK
jgi:translocation and assembly module TamB